MYDSPMMLFPRKQEKWNHLWRWHSPHCHQGHSFRSIWAPTWHSPCVGYFLGVCKPDLLLLACVNVCKNWNVLQVLELAVGNNVHNLIMANHKLYEWTVQLLFRDLKLKNCCVRTLSLFRSNQGTCSSFDFDHARVYSCGNDGLKFLLTKEAYMPLHCQRS